MKAARNLKPAPVDLGGNPITDQMVEQYEAMQTAIIKEFFPDKELSEASYNLSDLQQLAKWHTIKCLMKFDPHAAIHSVTKDDKNKRKSDEEHLAYKMANAEEHLIAAREQWVRKKMYSEFRRLRHDYSKKERGGQVVFIPWDEVQSISTVPNRKSFGADQQQAPAMNINIAQGHADRDMLFDMNEEKGQDEALNWLKSLEAKRRENLLDYIQYTMNVDPASNIYFLKFRNGEEEA